MELTVTPLKLAELVDLPASVAGYGQGGDRDRTTVPVHSFLVRGAACGDILFDLGCPAPSVPPVPGRPRVVDHRTVGDALRAVGSDPADVTTVVVSHLHWDHCVGLDDLPNARLVAQRAELQFAFTPDPEQWRPYDSWEVGRSPSWITALDRTEAVDGVVSLAAGLMVVPTPGHTPGSQSLLVEGEDRSLLLCGDLFLDYDTFDGLVPRPGARPVRVPPGIHHDIRAWRRSVDLVVRNRWTPVPSHDPRVAAVLAGSWTSGDGWSS